METPLILVTTVKGVENIAAARIEEVLRSRGIPYTRVVAKPYGFSGIVVVYGAGDSDYVAKVVCDEVPEAEKIFPVHAVAKASIGDICEKAEKLAKERIKSDETFAVRTVRRGSHNFTSIDVNIAVGARVKEVTNANVDLDYPQKILWVQILQNTAILSVTSGEIELKKIKPGKPLIRGFLEKLSIAQVPYEAEPEAAYKVGVRIGRAVQTFEIRELVITPFRICPANSIYHFIRGVFEGIESRYMIQKKTYAHRPKKVQVYIQDLYQLVRERRDELLIATSTRGRIVPEVLEEILSDLKTADRVTILIGAREGLPTGVFRFCKTVIDLSPSVTLPTDYASTAAIMALITALETIPDFFPKYVHERKKK